MLRHASALARPALLVLALWPMEVAGLELALPRGAQEVLSESTAFDSYALPIGAFADGLLPTDVIEGQVTRQVFQIDNDSITLLQMLEPMRRSLLEAGYDIRLDCDEITCGGFDFRFSTEVLPAPAMFVDLTDYRFLAAQGSESAVALLASASTSRRFLQVIRVGEASSPRIAETGETPALQTPVPGTGLAEMLEGAGRVVLDDLTFETGRTALNERRYASLQALSSYLLANPEARVALVGHTDAVGGLEGNITISEARARAVRDRLVEIHGVPAEQVTARGIGFLSPRGSNLTEEGRAGNRRVEAVLTSTQ